MNKALMISIQPQHAVNILNGKKTLELRTWIPKGYVGWVYVYVTKGKSYLGKNIDGDYGLYNIPHFGNFNKVGDLNGLVAFRFWFDGYDTLEYIHQWGGSDYIGNDGVDSIGSWRVDGSYLDNLCLDYQDVLDYGFREKPKPHQKTLYAWHIKKLEIFDEPKELSEFKVLYGGEESLYPLKKAPQKFCYCYVEDRE